jgi:hypothetical protein
MQLKNLFVGLAVAVSSASPLTAQTLTSWDAPVKVVAASGSLTKSAGCEGCPDSGAHSATQLTGDGYAEFVPAAGQRLIAGLGGDLSAATDASTIDYAFSLWPNGAWEIRERGVYRADGAFAAGDRFRVAVEGGRVVYRKNGAAVYTSTGTPAFPLALDVTLFSVGATLSQAAVVASAASPAPAPAPAPAAPAPTAGSGPIVTSAGPYAAVIDRRAYAKPALPELAGAGASATDPVFQSTVSRMTDAATRPGNLNRSYRTPSSPHQNAWSARGSYFYVMSNDGSVIPFAFDAGSGTAQRIQPSSTGAGGLVLNFYIEPQFSYVDDSIVFGSVSTGSKRTIDQYDFSTGAYTRIVDLDTVKGGLAGTYVGGVASSAGPSERIMVMFGGTSQDRHNLVLIFDRGNPSNSLLLDTKANTLNGSPTAPLNFLLHHVAIDRSGRFVMLYPTAEDQASARKAPQAAVWDTATGAVTELPVSALPYGHDAFGYGTSVNQDCCTATSWDAAQWQFRSLANPLQTRDLVTNVLTPKVVYMAEHGTWNNAQPDRLVPFISGLYRYGADATTPRAWDDEIVAVQTDAPAGADAIVWRFAHHRSDVRNDLNPAHSSFWYMPRPNVSADGRWVLFTSNWEKTLGTDPAGEAGSSFRQDVFLVELKAAGSASATSPAPAPTSSALSRPQMWVDTPAANATLPETFSVAGWAIDQAAGNDAGVDAIDIWAYPASGAAPVYVASAAYGVSRPDIGAAFGAQFAGSGFQASGRLAPGSYQLVVFARSRLTGTFNNVRKIAVTVGGSAPRMSIDGPASNDNVAQTFTVGGWALDPNTTSGSGVDAVHVWAYPTTGAAPTFVGAAAVGGSRPDVANYFGPAGAASGYNLSGTLPAGTYDLVVFAHSSVTGTFNNSQSVRFTVR